MTLSKNNWLVKLYILNYKYLTTRWLDYDTNLCHFCRTVFFWLPFKIVSALVVGVALIYGLFQLFFIIIPDFSWILHWIVWGVITWTFIMWYLADNYKTPAEMIEAAVDKIPGPPKFITEPIADFTFVVWEWIKAKKQRICPFIHIENDDDDK